MLCIINLDTAVYVNYISMKVNERKNKQTYLGDEELIAKNEAQGSLAQCLKVTDV